LERPKVCMHSRHNVGHVGLTCQDRCDLSVDLGTVNFSIPLPTASGVSNDYPISRNFSYFARLVCIVAKMRNMYNRARRSNDSGKDEALQQLGLAVHSFLTELPLDMAIHFPSDGSPPVLQSSFVANLHSLYYIVLMQYHHRLALASSVPVASDMQRHQHVLVSHNAARILCRLQETALQTFGLTGFQNAQRGFSFSLYAGLSCLTVHLVRRLDFCKQSRDANSCQIAIASQDRRLAFAGREYFTRHMRIIERIIDAWPIPELRRHVNSTRETLSADIRKPFVLRPSFHIEVSSLSSHSSSPHSAKRGLEVGRHWSTSQQLDQLPAISANGSFPLTPGTFTKPWDSENGSPVGQSFVILPDDRERLGIGHGVPASARQDPWKQRRIVQ